MTHPHIRSGVACCSECGAYLKIVCRRGCKDFEPQFRTEYSLYKRRAKSKPEKPAHCTYPGCTDPIAQRDVHIGRAPTTCTKHLEQGRREHGKGKPVVRELAFERKRA